jgi:formylglycine-generating enzyme required for sulfatase activity
VIPDIIPETKEYDETPVKFEIPEKEKKIYSKLNNTSDLKYKVINLGNSQEIELVNFGDGYWIGTCEISNGQFRCFDEDHSSRYFGKRHHADTKGDGKGMSLNDDDQPAIRVSWNRAMKFCKWLSEKTELEVTLPTEEQWETACLAGNDGEFYYDGEDFSEYENMADKTFATYGYRGKSIHGHFEVALDVDLVVSEGVDLADKRFYDGGCVTMPVGSYKPNKYGLYDMHGNAAEWTLTDFDNGEKMVKGGSYLDRPERCSVNTAHGYPVWQNVFNAGFRIVINSN